MLSETNIIELFKANTPLKDVQVDIGDDAALINLKNIALIACKDLMVLGTHFPEELSAYDIGRRSVLVNLSDVAAMGATPKYLLMGLTLPQELNNKFWMKNFARGVHQICKAYKCRLVGGDVCRGPLSVSVTLLGDPEGRNIITRDGAREDHDIYVTGNIGDARAGLENILESKRVDLRNQCTRSFVSPIARVELAKRLTKHATSMIDISDGLYNEIKILADCSSKGFIIDSNKIPISTALKKKYKHRSVEIAFTGGEDYELLFTLPKGLDSWITKLSKKFSVKISKIGYCTSSKSIKLLNYQGEKLEQKTYDHFRK